MTDLATKCNASLDATEWSVGVENRRVHRCASEPGHKLDHTSVPTLGATAGMIWSDTAIGAKAHQVRHAPDPSDPDYLHQLLYTAWGVIANAGLHRGGWSHEDPQWVAAAERWRDEWHTALSEYHRGGAS